MNPEISTEGVLSAHPIQLRPLLTPTNALAFFIIVKASSKEHPVLSTTFFNVPPNLESCQLSPNFSLLQLTTL